MAGKIAIAAMGKLGVNVDKNPIEMDESELRQAKNAITDESSGESTLRKRPGLIALTTSITAGVVLGGIDVPLADEHSAGSVTIYLGRGPTV